MAPTRMWSSARCPGRDQPLLIDLAERLRRPSRPGGRHRLGRRDHREDHRRISGSLRLGSDRGQLHPRPRALPAHGAGCCRCRDDNLLLAGLPFISGTPTRPAALSTRAVRRPAHGAQPAGRALCSSTERLIDYALAHPDRDVVLKPRHRLGEDTYHRMRHHPETLLAGDGVSGQLLHRLHPDQRATAHRRPVDHRFLDRLPGGPRPWLPGRPGPRPGGPRALRQSRLPGQRAVADLAADDRRRHRRARARLAGQLLLRRPGAARAPVTRPRRSWTGSRSCWPPASGPRGRSGPRNTSEHRPSPADLPRRAIVTPASRARLIRGTASGGSRALTP